MALRLSFWPGAVAGGLCIPDMVCYVMLRFTPIHRGSVHSLHRELSLRARCKGAYNPAKIVGAVILHWTSTDLLQQDLV